jgi:PAS domain S-box-containing protein
MSSFYNESAAFHAALPAPRMPSPELLDNHPVASFVIGLDHTVTHWNKACERLLGWTAEQMVGSTRQWRAFYAYKRPLLADLIVAGADGAPASEEFFPHLGDQGRWLQCAAAPLHDSDGELVGAIQSVLDVSARRLAQQQLEQAEKMASIGQLAAGVAHEINNPMGYIFSNFSTLQEYLDQLFAMLDAYQQAEAGIASPEALERLRAMRQQVELDYLREEIPALMLESKEGLVRVRRIVQDLKDFSRIDTQQDWICANLQQGIDSALNIIGNELRYRADVVCEYANLPEIECLPQQLNQVVMNLLVNAMQALGAQRGHITVRTGREGEHVWFSVSDDGRGIAPENLGRIFEPFFTTKAPGKGTGLGLSLAHGIVHKHKGRIDVESEPGKGSSFRVTLPIHHH